MCGTYLGDHHVTIKRAPTVLVLRLGLRDVFSDLGDHGRSEREVGHEMTVPDELMSVQLRLTDRFRATVLGCCQVTKRDCERFGSKLAKLPIDFVRCATRRVRRTYMISTCSQSAPCSMVLAQSAPSCAKSADRIDGAIMA